MALDSKDIDVLSIGFGKTLFNPDNIERKRLKVCAEEMKSVHTIVLGAPEKTANDGKLSLYGVGNNVRSLQLLTAYHRAKSIVQKNKDATWVVTAQDPFETALIGFLASRFCGKRLVIQEHGDFFSTPHWSRESVLNRVRFHMGLYLLKRAWRVRVVSERIKRTLVAKGIESGRIHVLPVATEVADFKNAIPDESVRAHFPSGSIIILAAARFVYQKNIPLLLHAFQRASVSHPKARLLLVGSGPLESVIKQEVSHHNLSEKVMLLPWTDSFPSLLKSADIFAVSSNYEGWGRVLVESMAVGVPVVTTDVGCVGDVFQNERHGLVVPIGDVNGFELALKRLISDDTLRAKYGANGQEDSSSLVSVGSTYALKWALVLTP